MLSSDSDTSTTTISSDNDYNEDNEINEKDNIDEDNEYTNEEYDDEDNTEEDEEEDEDEDKEEDEDKDDEDDEEENNNKDKKQEEIQVNISSSYYKKDFKYFNDNKYSKMAIKERVKELNNRLYHKYLKKGVKNDDNILTLNRVNKPGGTFIIPDEEYDDFLELYASIVEDPNYEKIKNRFELFQLNLGERQCEVGPLLLDIDIKYMNLPYNMQRIYDDILLNSFIKIVNTIILKYFILDNYVLNALLFEKPTPTKIEKDNKIYFKDGVHIYYDIPLHKSDREFIYKMVLNEVIKTHLFDNLPTEDTPDTILDNSTLFRNCWMLYGSTKIEKDKDDNKPAHIRPQYNLTKTQYVYDLNSIKQLSVRKYKNVEGLKIKKEYYEQYLKQQYIIKDLKSEGIIKSKTPQLINNSLNAYKESLINTPYKFSSEEKEKIAWARELLKIINPKRAAYYLDWLYIGWALCSIHTSLIEDYINWSKQASNFDEEKCINNFKTCRDSGKVCTIRTLERYALTDNKDKYDKLFNDIHTNIINDALLLGTSQKEAAVIYAKYGHLFLSVRKKRDVIIYKFNGKNWQIDEGGKKMIKIIQSGSSLMLKRKLKYMDEFHKKTSQDYITEEEQRLIKENKKLKDELNKSQQKELSEIDKEFNKKRAILNKHINNIKKTSELNEKLNTLLKEYENKKNKVIENNNNIIKQYDIKLEQDKKELKNDKKKDKKEYEIKLKKFDKVIADYDDVSSISDKIAKQFILKIQMNSEKFNLIMDQSAHLLGVKNGIIDLDLCKFRETNPTDYISLTMGAKYDETLTWEHKNVKIFLDYIYSLQMKKENAEYLLRLLSSFLYGYNQDNKIFFFYGAGQNGKSILLNYLRGLFSIKYCTSASFSILTKNKGKSNEASPEMIRLKNKRLVIIDEGNNKEEIQSAIMKRLTGNDMITARGLFEDETEFKPQCKFIISLNDMAKFDNADFGTYRRISKINFDVKFVDTKLKRIEDFEPNERPIIPNIEKKMCSKEMYEAGLWVLLQYYKNEYLIHGLQPPKDVLLSTLECKIDGNIYLQFLKYNYMNDIKNNNIEGININDMYKKYKIYCNNNDINNKINRTEFIHQLELLSNNKEIFKYNIIKNGRNIIVKGLIEIPIDNTDSEFSIGSNISISSTPINNAIDELNDLNNLDSKSENNIIYNNNNDINDDNYIIDF